MRLSLPDLYIGFILPLHHDLKVKATRMEYLHPPNPDLGRNRVIYDPQQVGLDQLEGWLQESGTYIWTVPSAIQSTGEAGSQ